ncbi:MAG: hypothetical protein A2152_00735 [Candidatus Levybacteria bacterium RBG_16_35_6]|nr:MAG: hypothetical protein A2152_00735 [Candidatus Levybacteria bacterium RBG_16_35_6]
MTAETEARIFDREKDRPISKRLLDDNWSLEATQNREAFRSAPYVWIVKNCPDARAQNGLPMNRCILIPGIAAENPNAPYGDMVDHKRTDATISLKHYDGVMLKPGIPPEGCGGEAAKRGFMTNNRVIGRLLDRYLDQAPQTTDPVASNLAMAKDLAQYTDKPVLAAFQDHRTTMIYPVAVFLDRGNEIISNIPDELLTQLIIDPKVLYATGLPTLDPIILPAHLPEFFDFNEQEVVKILRNPNFIGSTTTQNPEFLIFSTEKTPPKERYPHVLRQLGSYFYEHIPRIRATVDFSTIDNSAFATTIQQAEYPIEHIPSIKYILIEAPDLYHSNGFAKELISTMRSRKWGITRNGFELLIADSTKGKTKNVLEVSY